MKGKKGFTLVELMVVVLIIGILAAVALPLMRGRIDAAKWSEAKAAMGTIATALRAYGAEKQAFTSAPTFADIGIATTDLDGTYFTNTCYTISACTVVNGQITAATIRAANSALTPASMTLTITNGSASIQ